MSALEVLLNVVVPVLVGATALFAAYKGLVASYHLSKPASITRFIADTRDAIRQAEKRHRKAARRI